MHMYGDPNNQDGPDVDGLVGQPADWLDAVQDGLTDRLEADLGDGGYLRPWKTTDI